MATKVDNKSATAKRFNHQIDKDRFNLIKIPGNDLRQSSDLESHSQVSSISQHTHSASGAAAGTAGAGLIHAAVPERKATGDVCLDDGKLGYQRQEIAYESPLGGNRIVQPTHVKLQIAIECPNGYRNGQKRRSTEECRGNAARSFGVFHDGKPIEVELVFKPVAAKEVLDYEFHPSQTTERLASGEVIIRFVCESHLEIARECMLWREKLVRVEPPSLLD